MIRVLKRAVKSVLARLGLLQWRQVEHFDPGWKQRIGQMARYIPDGSSVLDLGCGKMWLRQFLKDNPYHAVDYTDRGEGTTICDFTKKQFPPAKADVAFVSGTLEYVPDAGWFVSCIADASHRCVLSYCLVEDYPDVRLRREKAWVNDFSREEILHLFKAAGFKLETEDRSVPGNRIFSFAKTLGNGSRGER